MVKKELFFENYKRLIDVFLSNGDIQQLADTAFNIFKSPLYVIDNSGRVLAASANEYFDFNSGIISSEEMNALRYANIFEKLAHTQEALLFEHPLYKSTACSCSIKIGNTVVAYLLLLDIQESATGDFKELFLTLRDLICQELQKSHSYMNNRDEYMSYLLMDMLTNKYPDEDTIKKRFETVDFFPADHMNVVVIRKRIEGSKSSSIELISMQLRSSLSGTVYAIINDSLVLLFNFPAGKYMDENILSQLRQVCANNDLIAGISSSFTSLTDIVKHYRLAVRTALVCQRYIEDHRVIFYDDVFDLALLEYCDRHNNLMDYVHSSILSLMKYDETYGTDYLYTFWVYTECGCNTQATASKLFIHKNTLVYRINKIKDLLSSDLSSGKDMFAFQLSMRILRMLGKLAK